MSRIINAIFEKGVFKPLGKVNIKEHEKVKIILADEEAVSHKAECNLNGIIDIAKDCSDTDLSILHDKYLYGEVVD
jgi:predicted DNA-binding antitoxin AbrB/MazE fold protein